MRVAAKISPKSGTAGLSSFAYFRRLLSYVWPQKRYVYPAIACILLQAAIYSASIGSVLPILYAMIQPEGVHGLVYSTIAQHRLDGEFSIYSSLSSPKVAGIPDGAIKVRLLQSKSPLLVAGIHEGEYILAVNHEADSVQIYRQLTGPPPLAITVASAGQTPREYKLDNAPSLKFSYDLLRRGMDWMPGGWHTPAEKMKTLTTMLGMLLVLVIVGSLAALFADYLAAIAIGRSIVDLRRRMYTHMPEHLGHHEQVSPGHE
jgi:ABC-type multidrug transport system fused ATPase/permease subunit